MIDPETDYPSDFPLRLPERPSPGAGSEARCECGHDAGSHSSLRFNCLATQDGTHATRCSCRTYRPVSSPASERRGEPVTDTGEVTPAVREWGRRAASQAAALLHQHAPGSPSPDLAALAQALEEVDTNTVRGRQHAREKMKLAAQTIAALDARLASLTAEQGRAARDAERYEAAIRWALGETDEFPYREGGQGPYWWRTELRRRATLRGAPTPTETRDG